MQSFPGEIMFNRCDIKGIPNVYYYHNVQITGTICKCRKLMKLVEELKPGLSNSPQWDILI